MQVYLYNFRKSTRSTEQPTAFDLKRTLTGSLLDGADLYRPALRFSFSPTEAPAENYAYIPEFGRYYFIESWTILRGVWTAQFKCDVLASYSLDIVQSAWYVIRSASKNNGHLIDTKYPTFAAPTIKKVSAKWTGFKYDMSDGTYVLGVISAGKTGIGAATYYAMSRTQIKDFLHYMLSEINWFQGDQIADISPQLLKTLYNPMQYVTGCHWLPYIVAGTYTESIPIGWSWTIPVSGGELPGIITTRDIDISVPSHPQRSARGDYLQSAPYSMFELNVPPFGRFPLDAAHVSKTTSIHLHMDLDAITGAARLQVTGGDYLFYDGVADLGVPVQVAQAGTSFQALSGASNIVSGVINRVKNLDFAGVDDAIADGAHSAFPPTITSNGQTGSLVGLGDPELSCSFWQQTKEDLQLFGKPLCEHLTTLNGMTGFVQMQDPQFTASKKVLLVEKNEVESMLAQGIFLPEVD